MKLKHSFASEFLFWLHLPIIIIWFGLFLIPKTIWPERIIFHFWYILIIMIIQLVWGFILYPKIKKITFICPLTTWSQYLRGYSIKDKRNYNHSFVRELLEKLNIKVSFKLINILLVITFVMVAIQYILK